MTPGLNASAAALNPDSAIRTAPLIISISCGLFTLLISSEMSVESQNFASGAPNPERIQGTFISIDEVKQIVQFIKDESEVPEPIEIKTEEERVIEEGGAGKGTKDQFFFAVSDPLSYVPGICT